MFKVFNPTGWDITTKYQGKELIYRKFSEKFFDDGLKEEIEDCYDAYQVSHVLGTCKDYGLVSLEWGKKVKDEYKGDYAKYKTEQEIKGLKNCLAYWELQLNLEKQAVKEMARYNGSEEDKANSMIPTIENKIKLIKKWLKSAGVDIVEAKIKFEDIERPDWRTDAPVEEVKEVKLGAKKEVK